MPISKKIRFEVFKRDSFQCAYCGNTPPQIILEVDHIHPRANGGKDEINNLITACFDCNRGKGCVPLEKIPKKLTENLKILKEKESQIKEYRKFINKINKRLGKDTSEIEAIYKSQYEGFEFTDTFKNISLKKFLTLLPKHEIIDAIYIAINKYSTNESKVISYFCGVCWNKIKSK